MSDGFSIDDVKDELMVRYTPTITWKRIRHTTCKRDPARQVEVREVYNCDPRDTVADAVRYLQRLSERYQQREVLKTRRVTFAAAAGGPKAIYSTRKMWPPDDCGFTDRYVLEGFTHQQVWEIDDAMMRFMYGDMNGRRPYAEALVRRLVETEDIKADLLAADTTERRIRIARSYTEPFEAEDGFTENIEANEWVDKEGVLIEPDVELGMSVAEVAASFLHAEGALNPSNVPFAPGTWYATGWIDLDVATGAGEERVYFLTGFTPEEEAEVYQKLLPATRFGPGPGRRRAQEAVEPEDAKADLLAHEEKPLPYFRWVTYTEINGQHHAVANARYELSDPMFGSREEAVEKALDVLRRNKARFVTLFPLEDKDLAQGEFRLPPGRDGKSVDILMRGFTPEEMRRLVDSTANLRESSEDVKDELMAAEVPEPRIRITRSFTFPGEPDADGNYDFDPESEWIDEEGESMAVDPRFDEDDATVVSKAADFLTDKGATSPSSMPFSPGAWYSTEWYTVDYRTGEEEERSYHLVGFTPEEEEAIYDLVTKGKYKRRRAVESLVDRIMEADDPDAAKDELLKHEVEPVVVQVRQYFSRSLGATFTAARAWIGNTVASEVLSRGGIETAFDALAWSLCHKGYLHRPDTGSYLSLGNLCELSGRGFSYQSTSVHTRRELKFPT